MSSNNFRQGAALSILVIKLTLASMLVLALSLLALTSRPAVAARGDARPLTDNGSQAPGLDEVCPIDMSAYWKLDETSGTTFIDSINSNSASCSGNSCPNPTTGRVNGALRFDGNNDWLSAPSADSLNFYNSNSFSIELWINTTIDCSDNSVFVGKHSFRESWWVGCGERNSDNLPIFSLRDSSNASYEVVGTTPINDGQWHHLVAIRNHDANQNELYVDGTLVGSVEATYASGFANSEPLTMGNHAQEYYADGRIDEVALYARVLLPSEIEAHYTSGLANENYCSDGAEAPLIVSTPVTAATINKPYSYDVQANGNPVPTYTLQTAPAGMTINTSSGLIEWTPTLTGTFPVTVTAVNSAGSDAQSFTIEVVAESAPAITSTPVTTAVIGKVYLYDVQASGAPAPTYSLTTAPEDMTINPTSGVISWSPTTTGTYSVTVRAENSVDVDVQSFTLTVNQVPEITSAPVTTAVTNQAYSYDVNATGSPTPTYSLLTAPSGMAINSTTGVISWTPTTAGNFSVTVLVTNSAGNDNQSFTIIVSQPPAINSTAPTAGLVGQAYSYDVNATGSPAPTYSLSSAPSGMTINSTTGVIAWTPTTAGSFNVTVLATNSAGNDNQSFTITVNQVPAISSTPVTTVLVGEGYQYQVNASGSPAPTFSLVAGPAGMTINSTTGLLSWTPTTAGAYNVSVKATNAAGSDTQTFSLAVVDHIRLYLPIIAAPVNE